MNPLRITAEGYGRFNRFDITLPEGMVAIIGPNGAGKSRLLSAIELALFAGRGELQQWLAPGHDRLLIELVFEHDGETYRVRRTYQAGPRSKQTVDFEHHVFSGANGPSDAPGGWATLTREDAKATDQLIVQTLGLSRATFGASAFLAQGNAGAFPDAKAAERKEMLGEILDPHGLWPNLAARARSDATRTSSELATLASQIQEREQRLTSTESVEARLFEMQAWEHDQQAALADADQQLEQAQQQVVDNAAAAERLRTLTASRDHAQTECNRANAELQKANNAAEQLAATEPQLADLGQITGRIPELEQQVNEQATARAEADAAKREREQMIHEAAQLTITAGKLAHDTEQLAVEQAGLEQRLAHLQAAAAGTERCDRCEQLLGAEAKVAAIRSLQEQITGVRDQRLAKKVALEEARLLVARAKERADKILVPEVPDGDFQTMLLEARTAATRLAALRVQIDAWQTEAGRVPGLTRIYAEAETAHNAATQELASAAADAPDAAALTLALTEAKQRVATARNTLDATVHDLTRARQQLEQLAEAKAERDALIASTNQRQTALDLLKLAERAFGRDGIPALIAENALPAIEAEANRVLELMPTEKGETLRVELRTQRELKSADHLRETLDILVHDTFRARPYETYSGGEQERLNIALRLGLALLLSSRRGAESRVLALDEPDALDTLGQSQLVDVIQSVAGRYERVLLASHAPGLRDAFETVLEIASDRDGVSYLVGDRAPLEVLA